MNPVSLRERAVSDTRWRFDGWLLLRPGVSSGVPGLAPQPSLGASQVGGVVAYRLAPDDTSDPAAYLRVSSALAGMRQQEAALGLRIRPLRGIPIATHAEVRATRTGRGTMFRPAAYVAGGVDDRPLSLDWAASGYVQAGYIAGEGATAFADGRASVDRELARLDIGSLRVGGGVWGGAQRGAARLDLGPTAQVRTALDGIPIRLSLDYRIRVAGDAQPSTGVALTLSTGF